MLASKHCTILRSCDSYASLAMLLLLALSLPRNGVADNEQVAAYVGGQVCAACHEDEYGSWTGSHHDLAMQEATEESVLGDFSTVNFEWFGVTSTFFKRGDEFVVTTDGPDGELRDYPIAYTFGVYPLQQYLIRFPGGRLQTLDISWDSRPAAQGGNVGSIRTLRMRYVTMMCCTGRGRT
jgi:hypothetical protein